MSLFRGTSSSCATSIVCCTKTDPPVRVLLFVATFVHDQRLTLRLRCTEKPCETGHVPDFKVPETVEGVLSVGRGGRRRPLPEHVYDVQFWKDSTPFLTH